MRKAEGKVYFWDLVLFVVHKISFAVSPLNRRLLLESVRRDLKATRTGSRSVNWLWALSHPLELISLLERYHMVERKYIHLLILQLALLVHFTIKFLVYSFKGAQLKENNKWDQIHYSPLGNLFESMPSAAMLNRLWFGFTLITFLNRLHELSRTVRSSIVNRDWYKEISLSQLNLAGSLALSKIRIGDIKNLLIAWIRSERRMKDDALFRQTHFENSLKSSSTMRDNFHKLSQAAKLYYLNPIDFKESYTNLAGDFQPIKRYRSWFIPRPIHRFGLGAAYLIASGFVFFFVLYPIGSCVYTFLYTYSLTLKLIERTEGCAGALLTCSHLLPKVLLNALEFSSYNLIVLPWYLSCALFTFDVTCLNSRLQAILEFMDYELSRASGLSEDKKSLTQARLVKLRRRLNKNFEHFMELVRLVHLEFVDIKATHNFYLNMLHLVTGSNVALALALLYILDNGPDSFLVSLNILVCLLPCTAVLLACAITERRVSERNLLINEALNEKTNLSPLVQAHA